MILHILHNFGRQVVRRITEFRIGVKQIQDIQKVLLLLDGLSRFGIFR